MQVLLSQLRLISYLIISIVLILMFVLSDNYDDLFLEEVRGDKALNWIKQHNSQSVSNFQSHPQFNEVKDYTLSILQADDKMIEGSLKEDGYIYNFWRNKQYIRGLLRRTHLENYLSGNYQWENLLDLDALAKTEKENWVYKGGTYHIPSQRALLHLSRDGKDATVTREFDLTKREFVKGGFYLSESRSYVDWISKNEIAVTTNWGSEDSLTHARYPRIFKLWTRRTPLASAKTILEARKSDTMIYSMVIPSEDGNNELIFEQAEDFLSSQFFILKKNKEVKKIPLFPRTQIHSFFQGRLIVQPQNNWIRNGKTYNAGDMLIVDIDKLIREEDSAIELLMKSTREQVLSFATSTKNSIYINILEHVTSRIVRLQPQDSSWVVHPIPFPRFHTIDIIDSNPLRSEVFFLTESFLKQPMIHHYNDVSNQLKKIQTLPSRFKSDSYKVDQFYAKSFDNTDIPYFVVHHKDMEWNGKNPTLIRAYGGFSISYLPHYSRSIEYAWLRKGGVYVLANIRGGGEYGPQWHQAGLKENRQVVFNDFYAVAEDLIAKKITSPKYLGITGGSNGGLLMGVAITQRPELFNAAIIKNPLLDMLRYHKLFVGSSWISEYGDPENPKMRKALSAYSPYQNLNPDSVYPEVFLLTSSTDDRVHPGHARRFAYKLETFNKPFYYYENTEGGHSSAANHEQRATLIAMEYIYLYKKLMEH